VKRFENGFILDPFTVSPQTTLGYLDEIKFKCAPPAGLRVIAAATASCAHRQPLRARRLAARPSHTLPRLALTLRSRRARRHGFSGCPVTEDGNFIGDDGKIFVEVSPGSFRPINIPARNLFVPSDEERSSGHFNMVAALQNLYEWLMQNEKSMIQRSMSELDFHTEKVTSYQASLGGMWNAINNTQTRVVKDVDAAKATLSEIEDADAFKVMSDFKKTEATLQSTLLASNKVLQPSLLNFMQ
jgi:hypothetical protein